MSIFSQTCPRCGATKSALADTCSCGLVLSGRAAALVETETVSLEEEAYETYLSARLEQARQAAEEAIKLLSKDPTDPAKAVAADQANQHLSQVNSEYEQQLAKMDAADARAQPDPGHMAKPATAASPGPSNTGLNPSKLVSLSAPGISNPAAGNDPVLKPSLQPVRSVTRARSGSGRQSNSAAILARREAQQRIAQKAEAIAARRSGNRAMPGKLRSSISRQAEQIHQAARRGLTSISGDLAAAVKALDNRVSQVGAPSLIRARNRHCPLCRAELAPTATRCKCGFQVGDNAARPELPADR